VEIAGIKVGNVERLSIDQENQAALVALKIKNGINIYDDANAVIKTAGLIGDKFVKIEPGGSGSILKPGGAIIDTAVPLDIEDMIGKYVLGDITKSGGKESR
jgi:phospholipid/cholesterol/gamma-HCH transport system substrate-binding protein